MSSKREAVCRWLDKHPRINHSLFVKRLYSCACEAKSWVGNTWFDHVSLPLHRWRYRRRLKTRRKHEGHEWR